MAGVSAARGTIDGAGSCWRWLAVAASRPAARTPSATSGGRVADRTPGHGHGAGPPSDPRRADPDRATADPLHADEAHPDATSTPRYDGLAPTPSATAPTATADDGRRIVAGACERTLPAYPVLEPGAKGPAVRALQCFLNDADYGPVAVDGVYGAQTRAAVKKVEATSRGRRRSRGASTPACGCCSSRGSLGDRTLEVGLEGRRRRDPPAGAAGRRRHDHASTVTSAPRRRRSSSASSRPTASGTTVSSATRRSSCSRWARRSAERAPPGEGAPADRSGAQVVEPGPARGRSRRRTCRAAPRRDRRRRAGRSRGSARRRRPGAAPSASRRPARRARGPRSRWRSSRSPSPRRVGRDSRRVMLTPRTANCSSSSSSPPAWSSRWKSTTVVLSAPVGSGSVPGRGDEDEARDGRRVVADVLGEDLEALVAGRDRGAHPGVEHDVARLAERGRARGGRQRRHVRRVAAGARPSSPAPGPTRASACRRCGRQRAAPRAGAQHEGDRHEHLADDDERLTGREGVERRGDATLDGVLDRHHRGVDVTRAQGGERRVDGAEGEVLPAPRQRPTRRAPSA